MMAHRGYALGPSVRGHTTPAANSPADMSRGERARGHSQFVFLPVAGIQWPNRCVRCHAPDPTDSVMLSVKDASTTAKVAGRALVGGLFNKAVTRFVADARGETRQYTLPICASCMSSLSPKAISDLRSLSDEVATAILTRRIDKGCVVLTFDNAAYGLAFLSANTGLVHNSVDDCLAAAKWDIR
jgi:hypothetical protein